MPDGPSKRQPVIPAGLGLEDDNKARYEQKREKSNSSKKSGAKRKGAKDIDWILKKKELYRARGKEGVPRDSKLVPPFHGSDLVLAPRLLTELLLSHDQVHGKESKASFLVFCLSYFIVL
jgi:hypothetical protein